MRLPRFRRLLALTVGLTTASLGGCGEVVEVGANEGVSASSGGAAGAGAQCEISQCLDKIYACGDCIDNDGDGLVDSEDDQCLGPCDNTEDSYFGGISGQNNSPCRHDCYFDKDTGAGNDDCYWSHRCDPLSVAPEYPPSGDDQCELDPSERVPGSQASCAELQAKQSDKCVASCGPLTPNGCDCFGCCELPARSGRYVWLGSTDGNVGSCDSSSVDDPTRCKPCTPVGACLNDCGLCEICVGETTAPCAPDDAGGGGRCAAGFQPCGQPGDDPCTTGWYCVTGCCAALPT